MSVKLQAIPVVFFDEGSVIIAHCVPLDVSSCGHDLQEARRKSAMRSRDLSKRAKRRGRLKRF
jgi:hypothetical protein